MSLENKVGLVAGWVDSEGGTIGFLPIGDTCLEIICNTGPPGGDNPIDGVVLLVRSG